MSVSIAALSSPSAARSGKVDKDRELQQSPSEEEILLGSVSDDSVRENESGPLSSSRDGSHSRSPMQSKHVAPDFKRRQLIFDSFTKLKQANAMNQRGQMTQLAGPKGTLLYTWGAGYHGQLGLSSYRKKCKLIPAWIDFKEAVLQVSCGGFHTAVLTDTGQVYTWGDGRYGQLGNLARKHNMLATPHLVDRLVQFDVTVVQISCGQYHTAAVGSRGELYSWGSGKHGQLGHGTRLDERYPRRVEMDSITAPVAASGNGAAAATALDAANSLAITAKAGSGPVTFMQVSCGDRHTAAVTRRNQVVTFGSGQHGQLGHGNGWDFLKPKLVEALIEERITEVNAGSTTTCALTDQGLMYLWGFGESIHPKEMSNIIDTPRIVKMKERVKQVACGQSHILLLTESGDVYAFGSGGMGQIGHGSVSGVRAPRLVLKGKDISEIAAGRYHSMAVTAFGVLYSWGCGESGQLAHNSLENEHLPRVVEAILPNVVGQICCGEHHSFCLSSIEHASIAADVQQWLLIEQEELQLKQSLARKHPNGLKSRHVLQVEQERVKIEANIRAGLKKEKEEEKKYLIEQLESINGRDSILDDVQKRAQAKLNSLQGVPGGIAGMAAASGLSEADAAVLAITAPDALVEAVAANSANLGDFGVNGTQGAKSKGKKNKRRTNAFTESMDPSSGFNLLMTPPPESKNLNGSKSSPAIGRQTMSALGGAQLRKWMAANNATSLSDHEDDPLADSPTHSHVPTLNKKKLSQLHHSEGLDSEDSLQPTHDDMKGRPSTSPGEGALVPVGDNTVVAASTAALGYGFSSGFQPLASRVNFMEKTTNSLARMKKFLQTGGAARLLKQAGAVLPTTTAPESSTNPLAPAPTPVENELFAWKKQFNEIHATVKSRQQQLEALRNSYSYMRPSDEDQQRSSVWQSHIRELNMKLVTLNTRLMEADENKKNYELYIMRMKEEDVQLSKQIDHLRHLVQEYDRLLSKMGRMNTRVSAQKIQIDEEIVRFAKDISEFDAFAQELLGRYESLVSSSQQQAVAFAQQIQKQQQRRKSSSGLCISPPEGEQLAIEAPRPESREDGTLETVPVPQPSSEASVWQENVQFYEQRFHKIVAATGLVNADDIINKYFVNDEIKADLVTEVDKLRRGRDQLLRERSELNSNLEEQKGNFVQSKWRDVDTLQGRLADEKLRLTRRREDTDRVMQHLTFVREGAMALLHAVDETCGTSSVPEVHLEETDPNFECAQTIQWLKAMEERLSWLSDQIQKGNKAKKKKAQAAAAAAATAAANLGAFE